MFTLALSETFKSTVKVNQILPSGAWVEESFRAIFKRPTAAELRAIHEERTKDETIVRTWMVGWEMEDQKRQPVEFTPEHLEAFLTQVGAVSATARQFLRDAAGVKEKN